MQETGLGGDGAVLILKHRYIFCIYAYFFTDGACSSIFVGDLDPDMTEKTLEKAFEIFGEIV